MSATSLFYWNGQHAKTQPRKLEFFFEKTASGIVPLVAGYDIISSDAAILQADIDSLLGTSSEFTAAQFDATAMGVDAFAVIVNMTTSEDSPRGQACCAIQAKAMLITGGSTEAFSEVKSSDLTDSSLTTEYALGANGNLAFRAILSGLDAAANGSLVKIEMNWISE